MTSKRVFASVTAIALLAELLFPPFDPPRGWSTSYPMVYWFLFSPPRLAEAKAFGTVNIELLALELLTTATIGWLCIRFIAKN